MIIFLHSISPYDTLTFADTMKDKNIGIMHNGILPQNVSSCLETIDSFLQQPFPVVSSTALAEKQKAASNNNKVDYIIQNIADIIGIKNISINMADSFDKYGIDSLSYMEIRQILEREYGILLSFREIYVLTVGKLLDLIANKSNDLSL